MSEEDKSPGLMHMALGIGAVYCAMWLTVNVVGGLNQRGVESVGSTRSYVVRGTPTYDSGFFADTCHVPVSSHNLDLYHVVKFPSYLDSGASPLEICLQLRDGDMFKAKTKIQNPDNDDNIYLGVQFTPR